MSFDPEFDPNRLQMTQNMSVTILLSVDEYEKGIAVFTKEIVRYFTDDSSFTFRTPSGPDAIFYVTAPKNGRDGTLMPGKISIRPMADSVEWGNQLSYSCWRFHSYESLLDTLHGRTGEKPLAKAKEVISKIMKRGDEPVSPPDFRQKQTDLTLEQVEQSMIKSGLPRMFSISIPMTGSNENIVLKPADVSVEQSSQMTQMSMELIEQLRANPGMTEEEISEWFKNRGAGAVPPVPRNTQVKFNHLFTTDELDGDGSPTTTVCSEWDISVNTSPEFQALDGSFHNMDFDDLARKLTAEVGLLPLRAIDTDIEWVIKRIDDDSENTAVDLTEFVAVTVPKPGQSYQYYWTSFEPCIWVRPCPL